MGCCGKCGGCNNKQSGDVATTVTVLAGFAAGAMTAWLAKTVLDKKRREREQTNAGATPPGNDLSLFYGNDLKSLTTITDKRKFLPNDIYGALVRDTVVCCVDIVLVRYNDNNSNSDDKQRRPRKECLLVERSAEPVKGVWWWPGGRILKGETFFDAAVRKAKQETGIDASKVKPIQVLGVWNTFFPTSSWDNEESKGTQTVNPIVLVELLEPNADVKLDAQSENYRWISLDPEENASEDKYVLQALLRLQAWDPNYNS